MKNEQRFRNLGNNINIQNIQKYTIYKNKQFLTIYMKKSMMRSHRGEEREKQQEYLKQ